MTTKRPYADPTAKRRSIYANDESWQALKTLGNGNASAGIRELVRRHTPPTEAVNQGEKP